MKGARFYIISIIIVLGTEGTWDGLEGISKIIMYL